MRFVISKKERTSYWKKIKDVPKNNYNEGKNDPN